MISQTGRYALQLLGYLARHRGLRIKGQNLAQATGIPRNYQGKILNLLAKHGYVDSQKGWGGGFQLREEVLDRPISTVLALVDGPESTSRGGCLFGWPSCQDDRPCPLHEHWKSIQDAYQDMLERITIGDLQSDGHPEQRRTQPAGPS